MYEWLLILAVVVIAICWYVNKVGTNLPPYGRKYVHWRYPIESVKYI